MKNSMNPVTTFTTKTGQKATIRFATVDDAEALKQFINVFSKEYRFTRFSGEQVTLEEEQQYLLSEEHAIQRGDCVKLFCFVNEQLAGVSDVHRDTSLLTRKQHMGNFGIIVGKEFRGQGVGEQLMQSTIAEAVAHISGLRMIKLECFATNTAALSLYQKLGFREVGRVPQALLYKNEYVDDVIMVKEL